MIRTQDKLGLIIAVVCFAAAMFDVFGIRKAEHERAACVVAEASRSIQTSGDDAMRCAVRANRSE